MSWPPDSQYIVSERLSEVMDDIGVNERLVMKRRRAFMLMENSQTMISVIINTNSKSSLFGSQTEASTTIGLRSDVDILHSLNSVNVIQSMNERKLSTGHLMMIQNENISPGYCNLRYIKPVLHLPINSSLVEQMKPFVTDCRGKILLKNTCTYLTFFDNLIPLDSLRGPAISDPQIRGSCAKDFVVSFYCESSPLQASSWLKKQTECTWPSEDVKESCRNAGCFVVPVGSKVSKRPELEWRVSTCIQERYLMFSLNMTQLRCYVLMKMVIKTYINPHIEDVLTSFMCKNVLFFCVADPSHEWDRGSLLSSLRTCLLKLKESVVQRNCPHFMIPENNLLAGKMTDTERCQLLDIFNNLMTNEEQLLFGVHIDDLGRRLKMKFNRISPCPNIKSAAEISMQISGDLLRNTAHLLTSKLNIVLDEINHGSLEMAHQYLSKTLSILNDFHIPLVSSTLGSVKAALYIKAYTAISDEAFTYLNAGLESDALSGRLKLASVLYCIGEFEKTEYILRAFQERNDMLAVQSECGCYEGEKINSPEFMKASNNHNEEGIKFLVAFCTRFLRCEINYCVPHELKYEIWRFYTEGRWKMTWCDDYVEDDDKWMELIVVDSVPYLYFLQYKVYGQLQRLSEQQQALFNLECSIDFRHDLFHEETALNLLGQCLEQENEQSLALTCYICSLKHRLRNNAARLLMCIQLLKLQKKYNVL